MDAVYNLTNPTNDIPKPSMEMSNTPYLFTDYAGEQITLTARVHQAIATKHPEVKRFFELVKQTLADLQVVRKSVTDPWVRLYYHFYADVLDGKFVVVVVKRANDNFVSTIYATDKIKEG